MFKKIVLIFFSILFLFSVFSFSSCLSKRVELTDVFPESGGGSDDDDDDDGIPPVSGMIVEIEEVRGEQKYIYIKLGTKNKGIRRGLKGYIFNDAAKSEKIGKFEFIEVYYEFSKGRVVELNYKIKPNALVEVEVDPNKLIK